MSPLFTGAYSSGIGRAEVPSYQSFQLSLITVTMALPSSIGSARYTAPCLINRVQRFSTVVLISCWGRYICGVPNNNCPGWKLNRVNRQYSAEKRNFRVRTIPTIRPVCKKIKNVTYLDKKLSGTKPSLSEDVEHCHNHFETAFETSLHGLQQAFCL